MTPPSRKKSWTENLPFPRHWLAYLILKIAVILAAIFIEAGFDVARKIVRLHWATLVTQLPSEPADAKSTLQEWAQAQGLQVPVYREIKREGPDHAPVFTAEVRIDHKRGATGSGANKRAAEQEAATSLLIRSGVWKRGTGKSA